MSDAVKKKLARVIYHGGLEGVLNVISWTLLFLGGVRFLFIWIVGADSGSGWAGFLAGAGQLVTAVIAWAVLRALGEIIRLQKKAVGLNYGGKISEADEEEVYACDVCGNILQSETWCHQCDRAVEIESVDEVDQPAG